MGRRETHRRVVILLLHVHRHHHRYRRARGGRRGRFAIRCSYKATASPWGPRSPATAPA
jgi:hypothetical protein